MIELELLYMGGRSSTLLVVNIGRTSSTSPDLNHCDTVLDIKKSAIAKKGFGFLPIFSSGFKGRLCGFNYFVMLSGELSHSGRVKIGQSAIAVLSEETQSRTKKSVSITFGKCRTRRLENVSGSSFWRTKLE